MSSSAIPMLALGMPFMMVLAIIAIPLLFVLLLVWIFRSGSREKPGQTLAEERALREMAAGLEKMEQRLENLETILLERAGQLEREFENLK